MKNLFNRLLSRWEGKKEKISSSKVVQHKRFKTYLWVVLGVPFLAISAALLTPANQPAHPASVPMVARKLLGIPRGIGAVRTRAPTAVTPSAAQLAAVSAPVDEDFTASVLMRTLTESPTSVKDIVFEEGTHRVAVDMANGAMHVVLMPAADMSKLSELAEKQNVKYEAVEPPTNTSWTSALPTILAISSIGLLLLIAFSMLGTKSGLQGRMRSFGKSKARLVQDIAVRFTDVIGQKEAKDDFEELIDFLRNPEKYRLVKGKVPRGTLMIGKPGVGKTLLAKAVAGEAKVPFFAISGSDFVEMFVGVGASRVRDMFEEAKKKAPCIIFIDEIDAIGKKRSAGGMAGHDEREQTLNQLLVGMDGFETNDGVIFLAATNRVDVLDPALLRPGRFTRQVTLHLPDLKDRIALLRHYLKDVPCVSTLRDKLEHFARLNPGLSGAEIANGVNEAALYTARAGRTQVTEKDLDEGFLKALMGSRRDTVSSLKEDLNTGVHEWGHGILSLFNGQTPGRMTIEPRSKSLGHFAPLWTEAEMRSATEKQLLARIGMYLGGMAAQSKIFGIKDTGGSSDIEVANSIAEDMVGRYGMSRLGKRRARTDPVTGQLVLTDEMEAEVKRIVDECEVYANRVIAMYEHVIRKWAKDLVRDRTYSGEQIKAKWDSLDHKAIAEKAQSVWSAESIKAQAVAGARS